MPRRNQRIDEEALPVIVPRNTRRLVPMPPERKRRLMEHLNRLTGDGGADPFPPEREEFDAQVAGTACGLCQGWCCRNGGDDGFLDERTFARARREKQMSDVDTSRRFYYDRVPDESYEGSCIFHGKHGCTLDRSMRSDVCDAYFCGGLEGYFAGDDRAAPVVIIAGEGRDMRTSQVITKKQRTVRP